MTNKVEALVINGTSDSFELTVYEYDESGSLVPLALEPVTKIELEIAGQTIEALSGSAVIDWSLGDGRIRFSLGDSGLTLSLDSEAILRIYDPVHPQGQTLAHPSHKFASNLFLNVVE